MMTQTVTDRTMIAMDRRVDALEVGGGPVRADRLGVVR